jgi:nucleoside-diphosphate-sugar epimerase
VGKRSTLVYKEKMKVLITGAGGYIGSQLIDRFSKLEFEVTGVTTNPSLRKKFTGDFGIREIDWYQNESLLELCSNQDVVIHAAGMNYSECQQNPLKAREFNGDKTSQLVAAAVERKVKSFFYISTIHVYADPLVGRFSEKSQATSSQAYATSHFVGESAVLERIEKGQITGKVIRVGNSFGLPVLPAEESSWNSFVNQSCKNLVKNGEIEIRDNPHIQRDFVPMSYLLSQMCEIVNEKRGLDQDIINLVTGKSRSLFEMSQIIQKLFQELGNISNSSRIVFEPNNARAEELKVWNSVPEVLGTTQLSETENEITRMLQYLIQEGTESG